MIALQFFVLTQVVIALSSPTASAVPIYGTKKYARSPGLKSRDFGLWTHPYSRQSVQRRHPFAYDYDADPYMPSYYDYYYRPRDLSLMYYPKTSKYEVYQAVVPYYYNSNPARLYPNYLYDYSPSSDPILSPNVDNDLLREREIDFDSSDSSDDNFDAIKTAFLNNLIMSQIYSDSFDQKTYRDPPNSHIDHDVYGVWEDHPVSTPGYYAMDEIEKEMKAVGRYAEPTQTVNKEDRLDFFNKGQHPSKKFEMKRFPATTEKPFVAEGNERANPDGKFDPNHSQSVYDIIKHMLTMEKELDSSPIDPTTITPGRKAIPSEDSLTRQLTLLKKN